MERILYLPLDTAALAMGADAVADAFHAEAARRGLDLRIVRNGSRGLHWLEPLVEVATPSGRIAYGPVAPEDVPSILDAAWTDGAVHPLCHGPTEDIPFLKKQE
ncbi:MAG: formate dehydrogenase, partial [Castellaniella sp.]